MSRVLKCRDMLKDAASNKRGLDRAGLQVVREVCGLYSWIGL